MTFRPGRCPYLEDEWKRRSENAVVIESTLARARAGDGDAFRELIEPYRRELQLHCYRILGSVQDAEDTVQETLLAAWRGLGGFQGRASVRAWLYRIATNRCLNALRDTGRRPQPRQPARPPLDVPEPTRRSEPTWFEPYPDALLEDLPDTAPGPEARYETRRRWRWRSWPDSSTCRHGSARYWCCATCSASAQPRWPTCSTAAGSR